jgi:thiopeptide-type bacteriocin biosynthesis protein
VDALLSDCGLNLPGRRTAVERLKSFYGREAAGSLELDRHMGQKFRAYRTTLESLLNNAASEERFHVFARGIVSRRTARIQEPAQRLKALADSGKLCSDLESLAGSFSHMHVNRLIRSAQNAHEVVIYDFLRRLYSRHSGVGQVSRDRATAV